MQAKGSALFYFFAKYAVKFFAVCEIESLKTLKCINKTTTLAKKITKEIYSIYNYIQKQKGRGPQGHAPQGHAPSAPC